MINKNRYLITQPDLNAHGTLHGGILMKWVDEACGMQARIITGGVCATRHIGDISFWSTARLGDILEVEVSYLYHGKTSLTFSAAVTNITKEDLYRSAVGVSTRSTLVAQFDNVTFVAVDTNHKPRDHRNESANFKPLYPDRCN